VFGAYDGEVRPLRPPIGLHLARVARHLSRAFDETLVAAGGSLPMWLVLLNLKASPRASQREIADAMGITEATLTHHLNGMEGDELITRRRDPANRRVHVLALTSLGEDAFTRLRGAAMSFDRRLRRGMSDEEIAQLAAWLDRLAANVGADPDFTPRWGGEVGSPRQGPPTKGAQR
jgi:MarR family transcriptional regulator, transcriptional regulator for hemolysin